jgi:hypothetical protein
MPEAPYIVGPLPPRGDRVVWHVPSGARLPRGWRELRRWQWWEGARRIAAERVKAADADT